MQFCFLHTADVVKQALRECHTCSLSWLPLISLSLCVSVYLSLSLSLSLSVCLSAFCVQSIVSALIITHARAQFLPHLSFLLALSLHLLSKRCQNPWCLLHLRTHEWLYCSVPCMWSLYCACTRACRFSLRCSEQLVKLIWCSTMAKHSLRRLHRWFHNTMWG